MNLYADEDLSFITVVELRRLGYDVITAQEDGRTSTPDELILARANGLGRIVLTYNRRDFERLHRGSDPHCVIVSVSQAPDHLAVAGRIDLALAGQSYGRWHIRVNKLP